MMFSRALLCKGSCDFLPFAILRKNLSNSVRQECIQGLLCFCQFYFVEKSSRTDFGREVLLNSKTERNNIKVYIKSFGCSHNMSDGEYMAGILDNGGYTITPIKEEANLWYSF